VDTSVQSMLARCEDPWIHPDTLYLRQQGCEDPWIHPDSLCYEDMWIRGYICTVYVSKMCGSVDTAVQSMLARFEDPWIHPDSLC